MADSHVGLEFVRNMLGGYQAIKDSKIIGQSVNTGSGQMIKKFTESGQRYFEFYDISVPNPSNPSSSIYGVLIDAQGPSHLENIDFINFEDNELRNCTAIKWRGNYRFQNGATTSAAGLSFTNVDNVMLNPDPNDGNGASSISMRDHDGTLTGSSGSTAVPIDVDYVGTSTCQIQSGWNMQTCQDFFVKVKSFIT